MMYANPLLTGHKLYRERTAYLFFFYKLILALPEIRELQRLIDTYYMRYFPQHILLCTYCKRPISKHLYSGIFKDPLDTKHNLQKKTEFINVMFHFKNWSIFLKVVKLNP